MDRRIQVLNEGINSHHDHSLNIQLSMKKTRDSSEDIISAAYKAMLYGHTSTSLLELANKKDTWMLLWLNGSRAGHDELDLNKTAFADWYLNGDDDDFHFRSTAEYKAIHGPLLSLFEQGKKLLNETPRHDYATAESLMDKINATISEIEAGLVNLQKYLLNCINRLES